MTARMAVRYINLYPSAEPGMPLLATDFDTAEEARRYAQPNALAVAQPIGIKV